MTKSVATNHSFASIEQLDEMTHALGWPTEYRQLESGRFSSTFTNLESDSWFLMEEQSSRRVEVEAPAPNGMFVLALVEGESGAVNGQTLNSDAIFIQGPDSEFRATLPAGIKVTQIGIVDDRFEDVIHAISPALLVPRGGASVVATAPGRLAYLRRAMRTALFAPSSVEAAREEAVSRILADVVAVAADHLNDPFGRELHRADARRALNRARDYIEAHLGETIRVASICRYAGTTLRSLERIFAREMGMSPQQYVKARRLNAVRRHLLAADGGQGIRITDVALNHGFNHLGRFSVDYRRYFGESARKTLRNR